MKLGLACLAGCQLALAALAVKGFQLAPQNGFTMTMMTATIISTVGTSLA